MASSNKLFRILMLHGYRQNEAYFHDKTGSLRKALKKYAELIYCQAPLNIPELEASQTEDKNEDFVLKLNKEWPNENFQANFDATLDFINRIFKEKGPFDAVFGFSQGGTLSTILCKIKEDNLFSDKYKEIDFKFAIICATNVSPEEKLAGFYDRNKKISISTLHIIGKTDKLVTHESALELTEYFNEPKIFIHEAGHLIPRDSDAKKAYIDFFDEMIRKFN